MLNFLIPVIVAIVGGAAITLQGQFMGMMTENMGAKESVFITYASGGLVISLILLGARGGNLRSWETVPRIVLTTGLLGLIIVGSIGYVVPRLGLVPGFTIIIIAQFFIAALIDHFGLLGAVIRPVDLTRALGLVVLLVGVWLTMR